MAEITIFDLHPAGLEFFSDSEGFMNDLSESELTIAQGGTGPQTTFLTATTTPCSVAAGVVVVGSAALASAGVSAAVGYTVNRKSRP